jgi:hypothetical protein
MTCRKSKFIGKGRSNSRTIDTIDHNQQLETLDPLTDRQPLKLSSRRTSYQTKKSFQLPSLLGITMSKCL